MSEMFHDADVLTFTGDPINRLQQVLDVAGHQIRLGQHTAADYRMEDALDDAEDALATARAKIADAVEDVRADEEWSGEAELEHQAS